MLIKGLGEHTIRVETSPGIFADIVVADSYQQQPGSGSTVLSANINSDVTNSPTIEPTIAGIAANRQSQAPFGHPHAGPLSTSEIIAETNRYLAQFGQTMDAGRLASLAGKYGQQYAIAPPPPVVTMPVNANTGQQVQGTVTQATPYNPNVFQNVQPPILPLGTGASQVDPLRNMPTGPGTSRPAGWGTDTATFDQSTVHDGELTGNASQSGGSALPPGILEQIGNATQGLTANLPSSFGDFTINWTYVGLGIAALLAAKFAFGGRR